MTIVAGETATVIIAIVVVALLLWWNKTRDGRDSEL